MKASGLSYSMHSAGTTVGSFSISTLFWSRCGNLPPPSQIRRIYFFAIIADINGTIEGPWESVTRLIGQAHTLVHRNGVVRIQTDVRIGTRTDKEEHFAEKVSKVESILTERVHDAGGGDEAEEDTVKLQRPV
jgi:uncharacterized protein YqgV (UPF0045/DUF77 family)